MPDVTKEMAEKIADKLKATYIEKTKHIFAEIPDTDGKIVARFGIRRSPLKDMPHNFVPNQIHLSRNKTCRLAWCEISREEWLKMLAEKSD